MANKPSKKLVQANVQDEGRNVSAQLDDKEYTVYADEDTWTYHVKRLRDYRTIRNFINSSDAVDYCDKLNARSKADVQ